MTGGRYGCFAVRLTAVRVDAVGLLCLSFRMILLTSLLLIAAPLAEKQETKVDINGGTYRVLVRDEEIVVARKAFMTRRSPEEREAMREAARKVTGCEMGDAYWDGSRLVGKLACNDGSTPLGSETR